MTSLAEAPLLGVIDSGRSLPIRIQDWLAVIANDSRLRVPDPVESTNPFSGDVLTITPHPGTAYVMDGQSRVGMMSWSEEEDADGIVVYGDSPAVLAVAKEVADRLGGRFRRLEVD